MIQKGSCLVKFQESTCPLKLVIWVIDIGNPSLKNYTYLEKQAVLNGKLRCYVRIYAYYDLSLFVCYNPFSKFKSNKPE